MLYSVLVVVETDLETKNIAVVDIVNAVVGIVVVVVVEADFEMKSIFVVVVVNFVVVVVVVGTDFEMKSQVGTRFV